ncbi:M13 family metallopeptidase [Mycoplasma sp. CSL7503-lung]|uniref:M13 family metallopeptidase n=1 Tax=Mycoplasma sp. CSL7503-lung TaxID=536372 RepID=UPI0021D19DB5|nr:M13 family metallopeptidase [Mycoplasma sp. CSL7503-lung]MCU4706878.1 M13 family metallopeptidase [Mycoplasma sp. CSL7503-lung]
MEKKLLKDDFFAYVNAEWLKTAKIPDDRSSISLFDELDINLEKLLKEILTKWSKDQSQIPNNSQLLEMIKFYNLINNTKKRDELNWSPAKETFLEPLRNELKNMTFKDFFNWDRNKYLEYSYLPFDFSVDEDFIDTTRKIAWLGELPTILPSKETYENEEEKNKLLKVWKEMVLDLLIDYGLEQEVASKMVNNAIEFDNLYKDYIKSSVENADYVSAYNLRKRGEVTLSNQFDFWTKLDQLIGQEVTEVSIQNLKIFDAFDEIFSDKNLENFKDLMFIFNLLGTAPYLNERIRNKASEFKNKVYSINKNRSLEDYAFDLTKKYFGMTLGMYYANTYFGEKAKKDVEEMVRSMIKVYEERLKNNKWLSKETIDKALLKLSKFEYMVGYPEIIQPYYSQFKVKTYDENGSIFTSVHSFNKIFAEYRLSLYHKEEDKRFWGMSPSAINAYYHPIKNHIVFPAAILSYPFYDINRSRTTNFAAIGAVIAHEISHGFDNNGSQFDENGKLNNWWTNNDRAEFEKRINATIKLYDGRETEFGKVNGKLTVLENIADLGGFECALEAAQRQPDFKAKDFFESWARTWRSIFKEGTAKRLLDSDVHSPAEIRANVILGNNKLFEKTYDIQPGDKMYVPDEDKVKIW